MKTYSTPQRNYLLLALQLILGVGLIYMSRIIFDGIMGAIMFFAVSRSSHIYLTEKKKWNRSLSAMCMIIVSFLVLLLPFITLSWMVYSKIIYYENQPEELGILKEKLWPYIKDYMSKEENMDMLFQSVKSKTFAVFSNTLNSLSSIVLQIMVMYFLLYFMLKEYKLLEATLCKYLPFKKFQAQKFGSELVNLTYSNLLGQGFISFVQGLLVTIGFLFCGINDAVFWGVVCFFLSFIPFVGAPIVFVPAAVFEFYSGNTGAGIFLLIWGFGLVINIDNVIRFYLSKRIGDVHPLITIIGVIIGIPAFGILGLVYGPLLISYFLLVVKIWDVDHNRK